MREIVRAADVSSPTLYHYFGSKEELLLTLLRERVDEFFRLVHEQLSTCDSVEEAFRAYARTALGGLDHAQRAVRFVFSMFVGPPAALPSGVFEELHARHGGTLARAVLRLAPEVGARKVGFVCSLLNGMLNGIMMQYLNGSLTRVDQALADAIAVRAAAMLRDQLPVPDFDLPPVLPTARRDDTAQALASQEPS